MELGLQHGSALPAHKFRHGVTDDVLYKESDEEEK
jgi:hypothetical protein